MAALIDITGRTFGRLAVIKEDGRDKESKALWLCRCSCGNEITVHSGSLRRGLTQSCGCLCREVSTAIGRLRKVHGHTMHNSPTYRSWQAAKQRTTNPNAPNWSLYGGRGIRVCPRWFSSFENFLSDLGERPPGTTLDRFPNKDGDYTPTNTRWASPKTQNRNKRTTKLDESKAAEIRSRYGSGAFTHQMLAKQFGVSKAHVGRVVSGEQWQETAAAAAVFPNPFLQ